MRRTLDWRRHSLLVCSLSLSLSLFCQFFFFKLKFDLFFSRQNKRTFPFRYFLYDKKVSTSERERDLLTSNSSSRFGFFSPSCELALFKTFLKSFRFVSFRFLSSSSSVALQSFGVSWLPAKEADADAYLSEISKGDQRVGGKKAR